MCLPKTLGAFHRSDRGNVTIIFALCLVVLIGVGGAAMDYARLVNERTELAAATDATVLAALAGAMQADKAGKSTAQMLGEQAGVEMWKANVGTWLEDATTQPTIKLVKKGNEWSATVDYNGSYPTRLMGILGMRSMALNSHAAPTAAFVPFQQHMQDLNLPLSAALPALK